MAGIKYRLEAFSDKYNDVYRVDICEEGYSGAISMKNIGAGKIRLSKSDGVIQHTILAISIQSDTDFEFLQFVQYNNYQFPTYLYKNDVKIWSGYLVAESYSEDYINPPYDVELSAVDGLGFLENYDFVMSGDVSRMEAIRDILDNTQLTLDLAVAIDLYENNHSTAGTMLEQTYFDADIFDGKKCNEVLENLLPFGTVITQHLNKWLIRRPFEDIEKDHHLFTNTGSAANYTGTGSGETVLSMGTVAAADIWPIGAPRLEMIHAWKDAEIILDYGKRESFLPNHNFAGGIADWTDTTSGKFKVIQDADGYYGKITSYVTPGTNRYIEGHVDVTATSEDFYFELKFDALGRSVHTTLAGAASIDLTVRVQVQLGSYYLTTLGWVTTPTIMEFPVQSTTGAVSWKNLQIIADNIPATGTLIVRLYQLENVTIPVGSSIEISGVVFTDIKITTAEIDAITSAQGYTVSLRENAAGGNNTVTLKPTDLPLVPNATIMFDNANRLDNGGLTSSWVNNGGSAVSFLQVLTNQLASYYYSTRQKISGCEWRGEALHLNAVCSHPRNSNRKFVVTEGEWLILEDLYSLTFTEIAGSETATATPEDSGETVGEREGNAGAGTAVYQDDKVALIDADYQVSSFPGYLDDEFFSATFDETTGRTKFTPIQPEIYWRLHTPEQIAGYVETPVGLNITVNGSGSVDYAVAADMLAITSLNAQGETTPAYNSAFDILTDTTDALITWTEDANATGYRLYKKISSVWYYVDTATDNLDYLELVPEVMTAGDPPTENTAAIMQSAFQIDNHDTVEFYGENIDVETSGSGTTKVVTFTGHKAATIASGSATYLSFDENQQLTIDLDALAAEIAPSGIYKDWIEFEFRDITAGTAADYVLDLKALVDYTIDSAVMQVDDGTLTVAIKIGTTAVTSLSAVAVDTDIDETTATGANTVSAGNKVILAVSTTYTGAPTLIRGKLNLTRT